MANSINYYNIEPGWRCPSLALVTHMHVCSIPLGHLQTDTYTDPVQILPYWRIIVNALPWAFILFSHFSVFHSSYRLPAGENR
eukprot:jgi/Botrbrau1/8545/Bobra.0359s0009.1